MKYSHWVREYEYVYERRPLIAMRSKYSVYLTNDGRFWTCEGTTKSFNTKEEAMQESDRIMELNGDSVLLYEEFWEKQRLLSALR